MGLTEYCIPRRGGNRGERRRIGVMPCIGNFAGMRHSDEQLTSNRGNVNCYPVQKGEVLKIIMIRVNLVQPTKLNNTNPAT